MTIKTWQERYTRGDTPNIEKRIDLMQAEIDELRAKLLKYEGPRTYINVADETVLVLEEGRYHKWVNDDGTVDWEWFPTATMLRLLFQPYRLKASLPLALLPLRYHKQQSPALLARPVRDTWVASHLRREPAKTEGLQNAPERAPRHDQKVGGSSTPAQADRPVRDPL